MGKIPAGLLIRAIASVLFLLAELAIAHAEEAPNWKEARQLLQAGKAEQAVALLEPDLMRFAGNADYDYLLGQALSQTGHTGEALFAFERVLMVNPDHLDARLKAAQLSLAQNDTAQAKELLTPLSGQRLGTEQQRTLDLMRTEIATGAASEGTTVRGYVLTGIGWDSNVTSGPHQTDLPIPLFLPTLTALGSAAQTQAFGGMMEFGLSLRKEISEDTWLTSGGSIHQSVNSTRKDMNEGIVNFDLGGVRKVGHDFLGVTLLGQNYLLDNATYRNALGTRLNWMRPVTDHSVLTTYFQYLNFVYRHAIDNAVRKMGGVMYDATMASGKRTLQYGIYGGREDAKDPTKQQFSYQLFGIHIAGGMRIHDNLSLSAGVVYEVQNHSTEDPLYFAKRHDASLSAGLAADYQFGKRWHFIPQYTYTRNDSNLDLYQYDRHTILMQIKWDF